MEAGEILLKSGLLSREQLEEARRAQTNGTRLDHVAVELGMVTEEASLRAIGAEVGIDYVDLSEVDVDLSVLTDFPLRLIHRHALFPIRRDNGALVVATCDPFDLYPLDELSATTGLAVVPVLAGREEIAKRIKSHLGVGSQTIDGLLSQRDDEGVELLEEIDGESAELAEGAQEASVVRLVNELLLGVR